MSKSNTGYKKMEEGEFFEEHGLNHCVPLGYFKTKTKKESEIKTRINKEKISKSFPSLLDIDEEYDDLYSFYNEQVDR